MKASRLAALPCPLCRGSLEPIKSRHGLVWVCRTCRAGAATVPILRAVAPRAFVNGLWQAALHHGRRSRMVCPSCARPFTEFAGEAVSRQLKVCVRCFWVWLSASGSLSDGVLPSPHRPRRAALPAPAPSPVKARQALGSLTAGVLGRALAHDPDD
jgi:hypothetical protein